MKVVALRRYPVKSLGGESLGSVSVDARGLAGDRWYAVVDEDGRFACGKDTRRFRRRDAVFSFAAHTTASTVMVTGPSGSWTVGDSALDAALTAACGAPVRVLPEGDVPHFDADAVSLVGTATLAWCRAELGVDADVRRLRTNVVVETSEPFVEESWVGSTIAIGPVELTVSERVERCRTIDLPQDGVAGTTPWLKALGASRDLCVAVYAGVSTPGVLTVGDAVSVRGPVQTLSPEGVWV